MRYLQVNVREKATQYGFMPTLQMYLVDGGCQWSGFGNCLGLYRRHEMENKTVEIKVGKSGADVYEIDGKYILKYVVRKNIKEDGLFDAYLREAYFYQSDSGNTMAYRPEILELTISDDEVIILMKKYNTIERKAISDVLLQKIVKALAKVHTDEIPAFLRRERRKAETLTEQRIAECLSGWKSVLEEHPGVFDESGLTRVAKKINDAILWHDSEKRVLCHGDFHWDNLLMEENGSIIICDWQGVNEGGASGDLSFFISRLSADGVRIDELKLLKYYTEAVHELTGKNVSQRDIIGHMNAANTITSFLFWHQYLHGSSEERVRTIYEQMTNGMLPQPD